jgi:hypothetical protein
METFDDAVGYVLTFGKHSGKTLGALAKEDPQYLNWLYGNEKTDPIIQKGILILSRSMGNRNG